MSSFHTRTIENILEPVAQQVSRLVILHEEAEDGNAMPDLSRPVQAVSKAVANLVKVGRDTVNSSDDPIFRQDMPAALQRVEKASKLLEEASVLLSCDPYSQPARRKLIEGAKGILQDTYSLLLCFDESEVRKIIRECKKVLDYLAVSEIIESMEDLVVFVKDLSPCLTKVSREVDAREKELIHQVHRDVLTRCLESVKSLAPILICSMKIFVQILCQHGGKGVEEAAENRNYLSQRMTDEINEIIRVLQLTNYDEDEWDADNLTVMKKAQNAMDGKLEAAHDWLEDPTAVTGGVGEKSLRHILNYALRVSDRSLSPDHCAIRKMCGDITSMTNALCELRQDGKGATPQAEALSRGISQKLRELIGLVSRGISNVEKNTIQQPAHTLGGRIEQAQRWLSNPAFDDKGLGYQAIQLLVEDGRKICPIDQEMDIQKLCNDTESLSLQLRDLCSHAHGQGNSYQAQTLARAISYKLEELRSKIQKVIVSRVVDDFIDITTPLKQFTDAVLAPEGAANRENRENNFNNKAHLLSNFSQEISNTARSVATGGSANKKLSEALFASSNQVASLTPQLINAGRIRMSYPDNKAADEHFENLRRQFAESIQKMRNLADEATDTVCFIKMSEDGIIQHTQACEESIAKCMPHEMVENTSCIARLANRVLMVAKQESENSEDPNFVERLNQAADLLQSTVTPMVQDAKVVAMNITDPKAISHWRNSNQALITAVRQVLYAVTVTPEEPPEIPPPPDMTSMRISEKPTEVNVPDFGKIFNVDLNSIFSTSAQPQYSSPSKRDEIPPRPPLPSSSDHPPPRPPPPETDDEFEVHFPVIQPNQPIMVAAHGLHQEVKQYSSKDNELIAAAKKMALLMAKLSQLVSVRGDGGSKRDLIACAKDIAEASKEVTRLAKELARMCTDKRMRTNILQVCERIPTIGTQLRILSTVKATMLAGQGTDEDLEATEMLVGNAQNLMQSVKETVRACEAASIKIRTDSGIRVRWIRKQPWYQY